MWYIHASSMILFLQICVNLPRGTRWWIFHRCFPSCWWRARSHTSSGSWNWPSLSENCGIPPGKNEVLNHGNLRGTRGISTQSQLQENLGADSGHFQFWAMFDGCGFDGSFANPILSGVRGPTVVASWPFVSQPSHGVSLILTWRSPYHRRFNGIATIWCIFPHYTPKEY